MSKEQKMAESHKRGKEKRKWPKAKEKKKNIIRPKAYQKRKRKKAQSA